MTLRMRLRMRLRLTHASSSQNSPNSTVALVGSSLGLVMSVSCMAPCTRRGLTRDRGRKLRETARRGGSSFNPKRT